MDELSVSPEQLQKFTQQAAAETNTEIPADTGTSLESNIELPENPFWDEASKSTSQEVATDSDDAEPSGETDAPEAGQPKTIKFKANGEEVEITLEEAKKQLALAEGAKKAFSDRTRLRKELERAKAENAELAEYRATWEKLEEVKDDKARLYELITGESYEEFEKNAAERRRLYEDASPEEQRAMDSESKLRMLEAKWEREQKKREGERTEAEKAEFNADKKLLQGQLEREFHKHEFQDKNPQVVNRLKKMLWRNAIADLKDYHVQYGKLTSKMVKKAFSDSAAALNSFQSAKADAARTEKKAAAKTKAQEASTRNYSGLDTNELKGLKPHEIYSKFFKR